MKCSRCAAELPETPGITTTCPQCGAQLNSEPQTAFSYLPPGAPPWPTRMPLHVPNVVTATPVEPGINLSGPASVKNNKTKRRSTSSIISSIALLILAPIIGITLVLATLYSQQQHPGQMQQITPGTGIQTAPSTGGSNNASSGNSSNTSVPAPTSFKTAKDSTVNISLQYPGDWQLSKPSSSSSSSAITLVQSQNSIEFVVIHFTDTSSASIPNAQQLNQAYLQDLSSQGAQDIQILQSSIPSPTIGGTKWQQSEATFSDGQGHKLHYLTIAVQHGKSYYNIKTLCPDNLYQDALNKYFTPMLKSVKFLS